MHGKKPQSTEQLKFPVFKAPSYPQIECYQLINQEESEIHALWSILRILKIYNEKYVQRVS